MAKNRGVTGRFLPGNNAIATPVRPAYPLPQAMLWGMEQQKIAPVVRRCAACAKPFAFTPYPSLVALGHGRYCSRPCAFVGMQRRVERPCGRCGKVFWRKRGYARRWGVFCSQACWFPGTRAERFWAHINRRDGEAACWLWSGDYGNRGYGRTSSHPEISVLAHRVAWTLANGAIPAGLSVCHRCDRPACCNPAHLFLDDNAGNTRDKVSKGRQRGAPGERNAGAKMTWAGVREFRQRHAAGESAYRLARAFGIGYSAAKCIAAGKTWRGDGAHAT